MHLYRKKKNGKATGPFYADLRSIGGGQRCTHVTDRDAAKVIATQWEREAATAGDPASHPPPAHSVADALQHLLDTTSSRSNHYDLRCAHLNRLLGKVQVEKLQLTDVVGYIKKRKEEGASDATVEKERRALGRALKLAKKRDLWRGDLEKVMPDDWHPRMPPRKRWLTTEEVPKILEQLLPHRQSWVLCAIYLGVRKSEVDSLTWESFDFTRKTAWVAGTKTDGAARSVPVPAPLLQHLEGFKPKPTDPSAKAVPPSGKLHPQWKWHQAGRDIKLACKRLGIPGATPNDLRRTYASWLAQAGASQMQVGALLGHADSEMAEEVYIQLDRSKLSEQTDVLPTIAAPKSISAADKARAAQKVGRGSGGRPSHKPRGESQ